MQNFLRVYQPSEFGVVDAVIDVLSESDLRDGGLIVLDSINTLQTLLRQKDDVTDSKKANHEAAILVTLLQQIAQRYSKLLIITNVSRARPHSSEGSVSWAKEPVGGRMMRYKSGILLTVLDKIQHEERHQNDRLGRHRDVKIDAISENCKSNLPRDGILHFDLDSFT